MKVNLDKTFVESFLLTHQPFYPQIFYKGCQIPLTENFKYLGVSFDRKLTWGSHVEDITRRAIKRVNLLKILAGSKWGWSRDTLNFTYKTYILPILTYCCEPLISGSEQVLQHCETFQNQALRLITGAVKTTPIDCMLLSTENRPLKMIFEERAVLLWERILRIPGCLSLWNQDSLVEGRYLKSQKGFLRGVADISSKLDLKYETEEFPPSINPISEKGFSIRLNLIKNVFKAETNDVVLRALALKTIESCYPREKWLRIYTDGSKVNGCVNTGAGVYCELFSFYTPIGNHSLAFDGEIARPCHSSSHI
ncbi:uncharacterized protein LOC129223145 [Uloborus diversus]|uniref:uncharacterized protein LOC129223145 n=1 Tax=Uloborus diversus TaxID=327109 RepID=UPI0024091580|nr:uncharacterized protein LOC129223145 [Uloborus diversus]